MTYIGTRKERIELAGLSGDFSTNSNVFGTIGSLSADLSRAIPSTPQAPRVVRFEAHVVVNAPGARGELSLIKRGPSPTTITNSTIASTILSESGVEYIVSADLPQGNGIAEIATGILTHYNVMFRKSAGAGPDIVSCKKACLVLLYSP